MENNIEKKKEREIPLFQDAVTIHNDLRTQEEKYRRQKDEVLLETAKNTRAEFIKTQVLPALPVWRNENITTSIALDVTGIKIDIGPNGHHGIHSHLPYAAIPTDIARKLIEQSFLNQTDGFELLSRIVSTEDRMALFKEWNEVIAGACHHSIKDEHLSAAYKIPEENPLDEIEDSLFGHPWRVFGDDCSKKISEEAILYAIREKQGRERSSKWQDAANRINSIFETAEIISVKGDFSKAQSVNSWQRHAATYENAVIGKSFFTSREEQVQGPHMYEVIKILRAIFETYSVEELHNMGVRLVRTSIINNKKKRIDCIGLWSSTGFRRIFIAPKKHVRPDGIPKELYEAIPEVPKKTFQGLEGLMASREAFLKGWHILKFNLPYNTTAGVNPQSPEHRQHVERRTRMLKEFLHILVSEIPEALYSNLEHETERVIQLVREGKADRQGLEKYFQQIDIVNSWFIETFIERQSEGIIEDMLTLPDLQTVNFGDAFFENMPDIVRRRLSEESAQAFKGQHAKIFESPEQGLLYAREMQVINMLKLDRRPTLTLGCGADHFEQGDLKNAETYINAIFDLALKYNANVLVPGTAIDLVMQLAKRWHAYAKEKTEEELRAGPRFFAIEPGKDTYHHLNTLFDHKDPAEAFAMAPFDTIFSPYKAGWTKGGTRSEYRRHIQYRNGVIRRIVGDDVMPAFAILNGGRWAALENEVAAYDGTEIISASELGRHSAVLSVLQQKNAFSELASIYDSQKFAERTTELLNNAFSGDQKKSISILMQNPQYISELQSLVVALDGKGVTAVNAYTFKSALEENLQKQQAAIDSSQILT